MNADALLDDLRSKGVALEADGLTLRVAAPREVATLELHNVVSRHKHALIRLLERERKRLEEADRRGLIIKWSEEPGYVALHDPTTGEWHDVPASGCLPCDARYEEASRVDLRQDRCQQQADRDSMRGCSSGHLFVETHGIEVPEFDGRQRDTTCAIGHLRAHIQFVEKESQVSAEVFRRVPQVRAEVRQR